MHVLEARAIPEIGLARIPPPDSLEGSGPTIASPILVGTHVPRKPAMASSKPSSEAALGYVRGVLKYHKVGAM